MLKQLYGSAVLLMVLAAVLPDRALGQGWPENTDSAIARPTRGQIDEPICYLKTASGQMINLRSICEDYSTKRTFGNNSQFQRQRSLDNIRVRSPQTVRSGAVDAEDSSNIDDR